MPARFGIDLKSDPKVITGTRTFDAPRVLVFSAWTKPEHLAQWWGPDGFAVEVRTLDLRPGGELRYTMTATANEASNCTIGIEAAAATVWRMLKPRSASFSRLSLRSVPSRS